LGGYDYTRKTDGIRLGTAPETVYHLHKIKYDEGEVRMNEKVKTIFQGKKIRVSSIAICAVLMLIIGIMTAFAAANAEKNLEKTNTGLSAIPATM